MLGALSPSWSRVQFKKFSAGFGPKLRAHRFQFEKAPGESLKTTLATSASVHRTSGFAFFSALARFLRSSLGRQFSALCILSTVGDSRRERSVLTKYVIYSCEHSKQPRRRTSEGSSSSLRIRSRIVLYFFTRASLEAIVACSSTDEAATSCANSTLVFVSFEKTSSMVSSSVERLSGLAMERKQPTDGRDKGRDKGRDLWS